MMRIVSGGWRSVFVLLVLVMCCGETVPATEVPAVPIQEAADTAAAAGDNKDLPLEPGRAFRTTTSEGSWISLDVSPDGRLIVFDLLGDLYTLPFEGGRATRVTSGMAFDGQPRFSPDGTRIVFTSDRDGAENVWIQSLDGTDTVQVTDGKAWRYTSPEWTPDGEYIVVSKAGFRSGAPQLWLFHVEGGSGAQLIEEPENLKTIGAAFGDDDRYVWFAERTGNWQYNAIFPQYQLAVYDRETGERYSRTGRFGSAFRPTLSPDGAWLVYATRHDEHTGLRIRDLANGEERWLAYPVQRDDQESRATRDAYPGMSFTPDSREVVVTFGGRIWRVPVDGGSAVEVPFTADVEIDLGPELDFDYRIDDSPEFTARQIRGAVPSPDGRRLAFTALGQLYMMDYPAGTPRRLTARDGVVEAQPAWSPDGRWLVYATWSPDGGHLEKIDADGGAAPILLTTTPAVYQSPVWSPDGTRIVAIRGPARVQRESSRQRAPRAEDDLVWLSADGGEATFIAPANQRRNPHFAGDGERIYLYSPDEGLVSIRFDGTDLKEHLRVTGKKPPDADEPPDASLVLVSPTGGRALAQVRNDLYIVTMPYVGGETPTISVADPEKASFPVRRLTTVGGQFPAWSADGSRAHWSIGDAHFAYDLPAARAAEDSAKAARRAAGPPSDEADSDDEASEDGADRPVYEPDETRVRVAFQRDIPRGTVVLRGARLITMNGDEVIERGDVVVRDNRIAAVGPTGEVDVPDGAETIDVSGTTIVPGFVDTHAHLRPSWDIHKTQVWQYLANLAYGVTTTRDPQTGTTDVLTYADRVETGELTGPRIYSTGPGLFWAEQITDLDHARDVLERYSDYYDTKTVKMYVAGNRQQRQWIIMAAREQELMPTTEGSLNLKQNLTQIIDGYPGHEHSFPVYPLYSDFTDLVAESRSVYTPTLLVAYGGPWAENYFYTRENPHDDEKLRRFVPHSEVDRRTRRSGQGTGPGPGGWFMDEEHVFPEQAEVITEIIAAGGRAGVGSHGQLQGLAYHWELWAMASGGLPPHEALRIATVMGADAIGLDEDLGSLEAGKLADLVVLEANPLDDIRNTAAIRSVMKNGRLYDADTLDEIWPRQEPLRPMYWQTGEPDVEVGVTR